MSHRPLATAVLVLVAAGLVLLPASARVNFLARDFHLHEENAAAEEARQLYTCSMHPFIIQEGPGTCPICGMDLVPVAASGRREEEAQSTVIAIDPAAVQNMGVRTAKVGRADLARTIRTVGTVGYDEARQYSVTSKIDGWIEKLHTSRTGDWVQKGQPLLEIYSPDLVAAQEEFLLAVENERALAQSPFPEIAAGARDLLAAARKRLSYWDITPAQVQAIEERGTISRTLTLYAPHSGIVTRKLMNEGGFVKAGMELLQLADTSRVWVYADIYEYELPWVREGQEVTVSFPYPREPVSGRISLLYPFVEPRTRTVKARIEVNNRDRALKPDMYVNVVLAGEGAKGALTVPAEAVLRSGRQETVFVSLGEGRFEPRPVHTGLEADGGMIQVLDGLHEGEEVVVSAQFMLDSESKLREAVQKLRPAAPAPAPGAPPPPAVKEELDDLFN